MLLGRRGGSSLPGSVDYVSHVAADKLGGPNTAVNGPTSIAVKFTVPASPWAVDGGLSTTATGLEFTDGTNTAILTTTLPAAGEDVVIVVDLYPSDKNIMRMRMI